MSALYTDAITISAKIFDAKVMVWNLHKPPRLAKTHIFELIFEQQLVFVQQLLLRFPKYCGNENSGSGRMLSVRSPSTKFWQQLNNGETVHDTRRLYDIIHTCAQITSFQTIHTASDPCEPFQ